VLFRELSDKWAYDISKKPISVGEIWDAEVINQSIEMILATNLGERMFNPYFGFGLFTKLFNNINANNAETLLDNIANTILKWEDRITLVERDMRIIANSNQNTLIIIIPYIIKRTGIKNTFKKQIYSNS